MVRSGSSTSSAGTVADSKPMKAQRVRAAAPVIAPKLLRGKWNVTTLASRSAESPKTWNLTFTPVNHPSQHRRRLLS